VVLANSGCTNWVPKPTINPFLVLTILFLDLRQDFVNARIRPRGYCEVVGELGAGAPEIVSLEGVQSLCWFTAIRHVLESCCRRTG